MNAFTRRTPDVLLALAGGVDRFFARLDTARARAERFQALSRLPDSELADLGLDRTDIAQVVLAAA